jgi:hypothetical protein
MSKLFIIGIGFFLGFAASFGAANYPEEIMVGENAHHEIVRLRHQIAGVRNTLLVANGLLAAIVASLVFLKLPRWRFVP